MDWLRLIRADAERLAREIGAARVVVTALESFVGRPLGDLTDPRELFGLLGSVESLSTTVKEGVWGLRCLNFTFYVVSGFIVVLTGLAALYIGNSSFGSLSDYASVFLWGTVVDEGFKLARRLGPSLVGQVFGK